MINLAKPGRPNSLIQLEQTLPLFLQDHERFNEPGQFCAAHYGLLMNAIEIYRLNEILAEQGRSFSVQMCLGNIFATACFLHGSGHEKAGRKLIQKSLAEAYVF